MQQEPTTRSDKGFALVVLFLMLLALLSFVVWYNRSSPFVAKLIGYKTATTTTTGTQLVGEATFVCSNAKSIDASFFAPVGPAPADARASVALVLSDGRSATLVQTLSGSGARYVNADESFIFWNKGNTAFVEEGAEQTETYSGCITASVVRGTEHWNIFASTTMQVLVRYPQEYLLKRDYVYTLDGPDVAPIPGVKFVIPASLYQGTNLSGYDTGVSVEQLASATSSCTAKMFLPNMQGSPKTKTEDGITYSTASANDAGAGNFYEETVYAFKETMPCTAVRYFIHATSVGNYSPGTVKAYDKAALLAQFDLVRRSLVFGK